MVKYRVFKATEEQRQRNPHRLGSGEVVFQDPELGDIRVTGIAFWARKNGSPGDITVTFPADRRTKKKGEGDNNKDGADYYEYVRPGDPSGKGIKALRAGLIDAFRAEFPAEALQAAAGRGDDAAAAASAAEGR